MDDLGIDLGLIPRAGRTAKPLSIEFDRDLAPADLAQAPVQVQKPASLNKIRDSHHALARVLATGSSESEASLVTGYSPSRISILKADPQFRELLEFYRGQASEVVADFRERMANLGMDALAELRDRLEEAPDDFTPALLNEIVKTMADRTGHAPNKGAQGTVNINVQLSDRMAAARERVKNLQSPKVIDHE